MKITLIGLGMCEGDLTLRAKVALDNATKIIARTATRTALKSLKGYEVENAGTASLKNAEISTL